MTSFSATIDKKEYLYNGRKHSVVSLKCPDGQNFFHDKATVVRTYIGSN